MTKWAISKGCKVGLTPYNQSVQHTWINKSIKNPHKIISIDAWKSILQNSMSIHHKSTPSWGQKESSREEVRSQADTPKGVCFEDYQFSQDNLLQSTWRPQGISLCILKQNSALCFVSWSRAQPSLGL